MAENCNNKSIISRALYYQGILEYKEDPEEAMNKFGSAKDKDPNYLPAIRAYDALKAAKPRIRPSLHYPNRAKILLYITAGIFLGTSFYLMLFHPDDLKSTHMSALTTILLFLGTGLVVIPFAAEKLINLKIGLGSIEIEHLREREVDSFPPLRTDEDGPLYSILDVQRTSVPFDVPLEYYKTPIHRVAVPIRTPLSVLDMPSRYTPLHRLIIHEHTIGMIT
jgi:hypothetical protein